MEVMNAWNLKAEAFLRGNEVTKLMYLQVAVPRENWVSYAIADGAVSCQLVWNEWKIVLRSGERWKNCVINKLQYVILVHDYDC